MKRLWFAWQLFALYGGLVIAYHAWILIPDDKMLWKILVTFMCGISSLGVFIDNLVNQPKGDGA